MPINEARKAEAIAARRAAIRPELRQHHERRDREREARRVAKASRDAERGGGVRTCSKCSVTQPLSNYPLMPSGNPHATCRTCKTAATREAKRRARAGLPSKLAVRRGVGPADLKRLNRWLSALDGTNHNERIDSEEGWNMALAEVQRLWTLAGDKKCVACKQIVPASAMIPPGPGNFYSGRCNPCAREAYRAGHLRAFGRHLPETARRIPLRDGSTISIGELAGRHRARQARYRFTRFSRGSRL